MTLRNKTKLVKGGYSEAADRIFRRATGKVMYGRRLNVFWSPSTDEIQMRGDGVYGLHKDAIHINTYRALLGRDDLRVEYIEEDLIDLLQRRSRGAL